MRTQSIIIFFVISYNLHLQPLAIGVLNYLCVLNIELSIECP